MPETRNNGEHHILMDGGFCSNPDALDISSLGLGELKEFKTTLIERQKAQESQKASTENVSFSAHILSISAGIIIILINAYFKNSTEKNNTAAGNEDTYSYSTVSDNSGNTVNTENAVIYFLIIAILICQLFIIGVTRITKDNSRREIGKIKKHLGILENHIRVRDQTQSNDQTEVNLDPPAVDLALNAASAEHSDNTIAVDENVTEVELSQNPGSNRFSKFSNLSNRTMDTDSPKDKYTSRSRSRCTII